MAFLRLIRDSQNFRSPASVARKRKRAFTVWEGVKRFCQQRGWECPEFLAFEVEWYQSSIVERETLEQNLIDSGYIL